LATQLVRPVRGGIEVRLHVQPQASKSEFAGLHGDRLKVRIQAKPVEGEANEALREFLAKAAGVSKSQVELVRGPTSRDKDLRIVLGENAPTEGIEEIRQRLLKASGIQPGKE
jgi:hypothetical protein